MLAIFLQTLPFFAIIGLGYGAARIGMFPPEATAWLTKFVFYFALSAMLLRFSVTLSLGEILSLDFVLAYLSASVAVYLVATLVGWLRGISLEECAVEAQCAVIGNTGFLGVPMLAMLLGPQAIGPVMLVLAVDLIVFSSLIVILITAAREGRIRLAVLGPIALGLVKNPMIVSIAAGLGWSALGAPVPEPAMQFLTILGAAATPGALFAIGASLADRSAERVSVALWLSALKLFAHPAAVAFAALAVFAVDPFGAQVMIAAAALPVAGNIYILAAHYGVAPARVSSAILVSTAGAIVTLPFVIAWLQGA